MAKTMTAKFAGKCDICGVSFPKGETIVFNGRSHHPACVESERAREAKEDADREAFLAQSMRDFAAGLRIRSWVSADELMVTGAQSYAMARAEAFAFIASITAATGLPAVLVKHKRSGKTYLGRTVVSYYGNSGLGHHEGWSFKFRHGAIATKAAA